MKWHLTKWPNNGCCSGPNLKDTRSTRALLVSLELSKESKSLQNRDSRTRKLLHDGNNHWFLSFCSNNRVQICDNLNSTLTQTLKKSIQVLYKNFSRDNANVMVTFWTVQKQQDSHNCGLYAVTIAAEFLDGNSPIDSFSCPSTS